MKVLIATDGSEGAVAAAREALRLMAPDASLLVLAVADSPVEGTAGLDAGFGGGVTDSGLLEQEWEDGLAHARAAVQRTIELLGPRAGVESRVESGDPAGRICEVAREAGVDVVVVGSRGHGFLRRALMGSISTHVLHHAPCPVLVVRET